MKLGNIAMRMTSSWRLWLPAASVTALAVAAIEILRHGLFMGLSMPWQHILSGLLACIVMLIPVGLYVLWRRAAVREHVALRELQASEALRDDMTHMLVHDLKSPLFASISALSLIMRSRKDRCGEDDGEEPMFQIALESQQRLERMIGDLLDITRAEAGQMALEPEIADMVQLVREAVRDAGPAAQLSQIEICEDYPDGHVRAMVDTIKMRRVVDNLLANATKFTSPAGKVSVTTKQVEGEVLVTISDTGPGIAPHLHGRIFDKFAQVEAAKTGHGMSVGLGLTFCKLVVEAHDGRIWVESKPGEGSAFTFALPLHPDAQAESHA